MSKKIINDPLESNKRAPRPNKIKKNNIEKIETFADIYFKENPQINIDLDLPEIKLKKLQEKIDTIDLEIHEKFTILIQMKALISLIFGDSHIETLRIHVKLGRLYNENHRPQSALRHLLYSQELSKNISIDQNELLSMAIEIAESHLSLRNDNKIETQKHINLAMEILNPFLLIHIEDLELRYRRDIVNARVYTAGHKYEKALEQYQHAKETLEEVSKGEADLQIAKLFVEISEVAEAMNDLQRTREFSDKAYETFMKLGMNGSANIIKPKVSIEKILECEEKYNDQLDDDILKFNDNKSFE